MNKKMLSEVMGYLGSIKTRAKARASRNNGKRGGRPRLPDSKLTYAAEKKRESRARLKRERSQ